MHCFNNLLIKAGEIKMERGSIMKSRTTIRLLAVALICTWIPTVAAWGASPPAALFAQPLNQIPVPEPPNLFQFVKSKSAAIKLGKAFFWDMQAGSDGVQACASCHFHAGVDNRLKNTVNPGARGGDSTFQVRGPNDTLPTGLEDRVGNRRPAVARGAGIDGHEIGEFYPLGADHVIEVADDR